MSGYSPEARTKINRMRADLDDVIHLAASMDPGSEEAGHLARYLCIRVAGFLEQSLVAMAQSCVRRCSFKEAQSFGLSHVKKLPNPSAPEIRRLVERFNTQWVTELDAFFSQDERKDRVNALLGLRHQLAHGQSQAISLERVREYLLLVQDLVEFLLPKFEPKP